jgi:hypothetical protein
LRVEGIERIEAAHEAQMRAEEAQRVGVGDGVKVGVEVDAEVGNEVTVVPEEGRLVWDRDEVFGSLRVEGIEGIEAAHEAQVGAEEAQRVGVGVKVGIEVETEAEVEGIEAEIGIGIEEEGKKREEDEGGGRDEVEVGRAENAANDERG